MLEICLISSSIVSASKFSGTKRSAFIVVQGSFFIGIFPLLAFVPLVPGPDFVVCSPARFKSYPLPLSCLDIFESVVSLELADEIVLFDMPACPNSIFIRACVCL